MPRQVSSIGKLLLISPPQDVYKRQGLLSLLAFAVLITYSAKNGIILLGLAFLISPMGLPLLAVQGLGKLQDVNTAIKNFIHS